MHMRSVICGVGKIALPSLFRCESSQSKHCCHLDYRSSYLYRLSSEEQLLLFDLILREYLHYRVGVAPF